MPTIKDVARHAGVAVSTVSRVLNGTGYVSPDTREKVDHAIAQLGFRPNKLARGLISRTSYTIALILSDVSNPFFAAMIKGVEAEARAAGYSVIVGNAEQDPEVVTAWVDGLRGHWVNGVLFATAPRHEDIQILREEQIAWAFIDNDLDGVECDQILVDHREGARAATRHLLELGHRRIGHISGPRRPSAFTRLLGFLEALQEAGIEPRPEWISEYGGYTFDHGYKAMQVMLQIPAGQRPTGIFCVNDLSAVGALQAASDAGLEVPRDISIVGYDDIVWARLLRPTLTTVSQPVEELGRRATRLLLRRITEESPGAFERVVLKSSLVVRQSTAAPGS
ncbi:MAG TPA: LacI family DNA-binding transcriptional regulator [Symbiobacteriaceae bacterium]|nr:LacI family DNA-binding transcriptional regulator [Symbiobacteriaceae bacterium]